MTTRQEAKKIIEKKFGIDIKEKIRNYMNKSDLAENIWKLNPYFYDKTRSWWLWDSQNYRWKRVDDKDILIMVSDNSIANTINSKEKNEIIEAMEQYGRRKMPKPIKPTWIQFKNKIVDIETGEEFDATPQYFATNPIPWELHKERFIETPIMDKIFEEWVGKDYVQTLYEIIAYCLIPSYPLHRIFCFIGAGMNGKSKFLELLRKFIGKENVCSTELDILINSRFEVSRLHKKLITQLGETNFNEMSKTSLLKKLSGGDLIGFEFKRKDPFEEENYAKIIIATNNLPSTTDKTIGFFRRWLIIDFPNQFSEQKDILKDIPEEEYEILAVKSIRILKDLLEKREFHNEGDIEERMQKYEDHSNPILVFLKENCNTEDNRNFETKNSFENKLNKWLETTKRRGMTSHAINKWMKSHGFEDGRDYIDWWENGKLIKKLARVWYGIKYF